jgi:hypothetical protein
MRIVAIAVLAALLEGCAGSGGVGNAQDVTGDERGGKVPYQDGAMPAAMNAAQAHCGKFGKKAQIIQMNQGAEGGQLSFECR